MADPFGKNQQSESKDVKTTNFKKSVLSILYLLIMRSMVILAEENYATNFAISIRIHNYYIHDVYKINCNEIFYNYKKK